MAKVPHSIALGHTVDETSSKAEWHVPRAHYLESWGDARAVGGTLSVVQPLILPLFGGRTPVEVLGLIVGGKDRPGYDMVQETWKPILGEGEFVRKWNRVLHDGLLSGSELPEVVPTLTAQPLAGARPPSRRRRFGGPGRGGWPRDRFLPSPSLHDGRFANDGWLQELPDPLTKITWDNPALVSPKTAESLGLASGVVVRIRHAGRSLELPVWLLRGWRRCSGPTLGSVDYVRADWVWVGFDHVTRLRAFTGTWPSTAASSSPVSTHLPLSATQEHGSMEVARRARVYPEPSFD
jgi:molybdopterin-containing oxidoreductase family iron-sulfur binding subunit